MVFHPLHQRVDGLKAEAVLLAPVEAVGLVDEKDAAQRALDDAVGQGGGVAGVAAHEVSPAHLHQLPALEGADGLEVFCHEPGDGGLAGAGVAGEDHVHREAGGLEARRRTALLHLNVIGEAEDVFLHRCKTHEVVQLFPDLFHCAGIGGGQQVEELLGSGVVEGKVQAVLPGSQCDRSGKRGICLQTVFAQSAKYLIAAGRKPRRTLLRAALGRHIVPHIRARRQGQAEAGLHFCGQRVELLGCQRGEGFPRKGAGLTDIAQRRDEGRTELVSQRLPALPGEEDEVLAAGGDAAHRPGSKRRSGVHEDALLVDKIPAGQGRTALDGEVCQRLQKARVAALVVLKDQDLARRVEGGVQILQKELFSPRVGVKRQIHDGQLIALQKTPGGHAAGRLRQSEMPPRAGRTAEQDDVPGRRGLRPQHEGPAHRPHDAVHEGVLPQHRLFHLSGQPFEAAQMLLSDFGGAFGQQAVGLHILEHLPALGQRLLCGVSAQLGVLFFQHFVQLFLLLEQGCAPIGQAGLFRRRFLRIKAQFSSRAEHSVHQVLPIVGVCHLPASVLRFFQV